MYKITINTDSYKNMKCSKNTWEKGTVNNFMNAINGWNTTEKDILSLTWRIKTFAQNAINDNWDNEKETYTEKFTEWKSKPENQLIYIWIY